MPVELTYTTLTDTLKNYLERGGATDDVVNEQLPSIIQLGQVRLTREAKGLITQTAQTGAMEAGNPIVQKPAYWRNTKSFNFGTGTGFNTRKFLYLRSYEYCRLFWPDPTASQEPQFYADYDFEHWLVVPTPVLAHPFEVLEDDFVQPIDDSNQRNFWTKYAPDLLLHACLLECQVFLKNRDVVDNQSAYYDRLLKGVNFEDELRKVDRSQEEGSK